MPLVNLLVTEAGGYLHNTIHESHTTCVMCRTPVAGWDRCWACNERRKTHGADLADRVGLLTYAIEGSQSAHTMHRYKDNPAQNAPLRVVQLLAATALMLHNDCLTSVAGAPLTSWAVVPSLRGRSGTHPLRNIVAPFINGTELQVTAGTATGSRTTDPSLFRVGPIKPRSHVLIIDDTWASGAHAQSLALTMRAAGATRISALILARWLRPGFAQNKQFISDRLTSRYDPRLCPWTAIGTCPTAT